MDWTLDTHGWENLTYAEKNRQMFLREKALLACFLEHGAISRSQHDESLRYLAGRMPERAV